MSALSYSYSTATCYLAGIAFFHNMKGLKCDWNAMPQVQRALQGLKRVRPQSRVVRTPITLDYMSILKKSIAHSVLTSYDQRCVWACMCLAHFGFFRMGELTSSGLSDPLRTADVLASSHKISIVLRKSKTDQGGRGATVTLVSSGKPICAVKAMDLFLPYRLAYFPPGPLFVLNDGRQLTVHTMNMLIKSLMASAGIDPTSFSSHSFRAGAATSAAANGASAWQIKNMGRWKSDVFHKYIRPNKLHSLGLVS